MRNTYQNCYTNERLLINTIIDGTNLKIIPERDGLILFDQVKSVRLAHDKSIDDSIKENLGRLLDGFDLIGTEDETIDVERKVLSELKKTQISFMDGDYKKEFLPALILCLDLRGFSEFARDNPKFKVKEFLEKYTQELLASIHIYDVSYYKLLGDGALIIWDNPDRKSLDKAVMLFKLLRLVVRDVRTRYGFERNIAGGISFDEVYKYEIGAECSGLKYRDYIGYGINYVSRLQSLADSGELLANKNILTGFQLEAVPLSEDSIREKKSLRGVKGIRDEDFEEIFVLVEAPS